ncbi:MAG TPA: right-handed parallel beta-helix repeat-containing protein [Cytophagaceae bacterium]|nr:right-handed parallel beta-helix repeat-containing protein [Cytophagaceae bacterium]
MRNLSFLIKLVGLSLLILAQLLLIQNAKSATFTVSSNADAGANTLRQCIISANGAAGADIINFNFGVPTTITLATCLPQITGQLIIDGYSDPGASAGNLMIEVISPAGCNGFDFSTNSGGSTIRGLVISGGTTGIYLESSNGHVVTGNYIGITRAGTALATSRLTDCIHIKSSNSCYIGGTGGQIDRNIISGATQDGIRIESSTGTVIINNYIGTDYTGNAALGNNHYGIEGYSSSHNTRVGGNTLSERNIISANTQDGAYFNTCKYPVIKGNICGMGANGTTKLGNGMSGISINYTSGGHAQIGGLTAAERNYFSCNGKFGAYADHADSIIFEGNWIGVDMATGNQALYGNYDAGITVVGSSDIRIGGSVAGAGNISSGNGENGGFTGADGFSIFNVTPRPTIKGNIIGLGADGVTFLQNMAHGIECLTCDDGVIGGTSLIERNLIAGSGNQGIQLVTSPRVTVVNNYIGTDASGLLNRGGLQNGIHVSNSANVVIGGTTAGTRNLVVGNAIVGITVDGTSSGIIIKGNFIGLGSDGLTAIGNKSMGIQIAGNTASNATIGGYTALERNIISSNGTGNSHHGISIDNNISNHKIINNYIGTDSTGTVARGNAGSGIYLNNNVNNVTIDQNIVSKNGSYGIILSAVSNVKVTNNKIGTDITGTIDFGNTNDGLHYAGASVTDTAGGLLSNANIIAFNNGSSGVYLEAASQKNTITFNSIFCNKGPGITLAGTANESVPAPVILSSTANSINGTSTINGNIIHVYRNVKADGGVKCDCEGEIYVGTTTVAGGVWSLTHNLGLSIAAAASVTATQTTVAGSTSQFTPCTTPLPVELISFSATKNDDHSVSLAWSTASERNNNRFELQRSADGINFETIATIAGYGNSNMIINYSAMDNSPSVGENYYRLKQVDNDGKFSFSKINNLDFNGNKFSIIPANDGFTLVSPVGENNEISYQVFSMTGVTVATGKVEVNGGINKYKIKLNNLPDAVYIVCASENGSSIRQKVLIAE